jgi:uncharacterized delta-60 repeat protein
VREEEAEEEVKRLSFGRRALTVLAAPAILLAFPAAGMAQLDGSLDTAFDGPAGGGNGKFQYQFNTQAGVLRDVVVQSNGKIVAVGDVDTDLTAGFDRDLLLTRFNANGTLDTSFDGPSGTGNGAFTLPLDGGETHGRAIELDSEGRIVIGGSTFQAGTNQNHFAIRLDPVDGDMDDTFSANGVATTSHSAGDDFALALTVDKFDQPITFGHSGGDFAVARFEEDGDVDNTFSSDGRQTVDVQSGDTGLAIGIQPGGSKILLVGRSAVNNGDLAMARLDPSDGSLDPTFDGPAGASSTVPGNGKFSLPLSPGNTGFDEGVAVVPQGTSKIVVGATSAVDSSFALVRLNTSDGDLDTTFDTDGIVQTDFGLGNDQMRDLEVDSKGRLVAVGLAAGTGSDFAAARYSSEGVLDPFFDGDTATGDGKLSFGVGAGSDEADALRLAPDGDIVMVGDSAETPGKAALARLQVDLIEPNTFTAGPSGTITDTNPVFTITSNETASSVQCTIDSAPVACAIGGGQQFGPFPDGPHTFTAAAVDQSGNLDSVPASRSFTVDTTPPDGSITGGTGLTGDSTPQLTFSSDEAGSTFQCKVDPPSPAPAGSFAPCTSPLVIGPLQDGDSTFTVRSTDAVGNVDPSDAVGTVTVDTTAPVVTITGGPPAVLEGKSALPVSFEFSVDDPAATAECSLDATPFAPCTSPFGATVGIGAHTFQVRATDEAGNTSAPAGRAVTVKQPAAPQPPRKCKKGRKLKKGKCVKKRRKRKRR